MRQCADYTGAAHQLETALATGQQLTSDSHALTDSRRLELMRALLLSGDSQGMERIYRSMMQLTPASPLAPQAEAVMADSRFFNGDFAGALKIYNSLPISTFPADVKSGTLYRKGVAQVKLSLFNEAAVTFASLLSDEQYNGIARFYLAYISYVKEDYRRALIDFENLPSDVAFDMGADFYIGQILFAGGYYDKVLGMEQRLLGAASRIDSPDRRALAEAYRLLGESAHARGLDLKARTWLTRHTELHFSGGELSARYILGTFSYQEGNYDEAAAMLAPVGDLDNAMGQSALLYLGQCAARSGDYSVAAIRFDRAARMGFDPKVAETALYDYAAAVARGGNVPFGSATSLLEEFINRYPDSPYAPAVDEYLATGYYREHRYADALARIDRIRRPSASALLLRQRAQFDLGTDLLSAGRASEAKGYLADAAAGSNADVALNARLWLADCRYRLKDYKSALNDYTRFLNEAPRADAHRPTAAYNRAYTLFQLGMYTAASQAFEETLNTSLPPQLKADAMLRVADCQNFTGNVAGALASYRKAAAMPEAGGIDYAIFQAANMLGVQGHNSEKAATLEQLLRDRPTSSWCSAALAELAEARQAMGDLAGARAALDRLENDYPDSEQLRAATLSLADALADKGNTARAIDTYEQIVRRWPSSNQARVASENLQSICTEQGQLDRYLAFIKSVPGAPQPDADKVASLSYQAAMNALERNASDIKPLEDFVANYPQSPNTPDALMELADYYRSISKSSKSLELAERVIDSYPHSNAVASALIMKASILRDRGMNAEASAIYKTLLSRFGNTYARQAYEGLMYTASSPELTLNYANRFLALPDIPEVSRIAARLTRADALVKCGRYEDALTDLRPLTSDMRSATGGHAAVLMAQVYLNTKRPEQAQQLMTRFTAGGCDDPYFLARGYIALADAYSALGKKDLARQYLEALKENYPDANSEIKAMINARLFY